MVYSEIHMFLLVFFFFSGGGGKDRFRIFQANNNSLQQLGLSMHEHFFVLFVYMIMCIVH